MTHVGWWWAAAICALVISGCASHHYGMSGYGKGEAFWEKGRRDVAELVAKSVPDKEKAARTTELMNEIMNELKASNEQSRALHRKLYELNADYNAAPEDFTKLLDDLHNSRMRSAAKVLALRFRMKEQLTPGEWKSLSDGLMAYGSRYMTKDREAGGKSSD